MNDNINQNNDCWNARDCNFNTSACDDATTKQTDMSGSSGELPHTGSGSGDACPDEIKTSGVGTGIAQPPAPDDCDDAEYVWVARPNDCRPADMVDNADVKGAAKEKNARDGVGVPYYADCANTVDNADCAGVAGNPDAKEAGCSAAEKKSSVDGGTDCESERKACFSLRDKLFDELDLMFAARSDNARKLVMPAELEEISDTETLIDRFLLRPHSHRCGELLTSLTKAFFAEAVAVMIIDEASAERPLTPLKNR